MRHSLLPLFLVILAWDAVTLDVEGNPLSAEMAITEYRVYRCGTSVTCTKDIGILVGTSTSTEFEITTQPLPSSYSVTAVNKAGESSSSLPLKVVPADKPKNPRLK